MGSAVQFREYQFSGNFYRLIRSRLIENNSAILDTSALVEGERNISYGLIFGPYWVLSAKKQLCTVSNGKNCYRFIGNPLDYLDSEIARWKFPHDIEFPVPFFGGALTIFGYELRHLMERLVPGGERKDGCPDLYAAFHDAVLSFDHNRNKLIVTVSDCNGLGATALNTRLDNCCRLVEKLLTDFENLQNSSDRLEGKIFLADAPMSNFSRDGYCMAVEQVKRHIREGDIYQANLSQAYNFDFSGDPLNIYDRLRVKSPAPFGGFIRMGGRALLSSSPERFVKRVGNELSTYPIKGTRKRGATVEEDETLKSALIKSKKDRAELAMIVDLERNDIGRIVEFGSVVVNRDCFVQSFESVHHLVSEVTGVLRRDVDSPISVIKAVFPGGSITGAPKIKAMDILSKIETVARSLYTGSMGWINFNRDMDTNIIIRSITIDGGVGRFQVGGGIVADSQPDLEYQETLDKAKGILESLGVREEGK